MLIRYISDIHLELMRQPQKFLKKINNTNNAEVLILAGDIGNPNKSHYTEFLTHCSKLFPKTFVVYGNHEYYRNNILTGLTFPNLHNVHLLDNTTYEYNNYCFAGTTLWSNVSDVDCEINDIYAIENMTKDIYQQLHENSVEFIMKVKESKNTVLMISHHIPLIELIDEKYKDSLYNSWFASDLKSIFPIPNVKHWFYGHTHSDREDFYYGIEFHCNPVGYVGEKKVVLEKYTNIE